MKEAAAAAARSEYKEIPINNINNVANYRKTFNDKSLKELAASIKSKGVIEPIIVKPYGVTAFQVIAGERRVRAAIIAGLVTIPAIIRDLEDGDVLVVQLIENVQREAVPFMEEAYAFKKLRDDRAFDVEEICKIVGKSDAYVYMMLKLCELPDDVRSIAEKGWLSKSVTQLLSTAKDPVIQVQAANDLARTQKDRLITLSGAKNYLRDNFGDSATRLKRERVARLGPGSEFTANWKKFLVRFDSKQFDHFKRIVRDRTEVGVWVEAVDMVMRRTEEAA